MTNRIHPRGFTLIELLTVIAIVAVLGAILIPAIGRVRERAIATQSVSNLRQIFTGFAGYAAENNNRWPPPQPRWSNAVLPYVEVNPELESNSERATDEALERSIFISPGWEQDLVKEGYGDWEEFWRQTYGMNVLLPDTLTVGDRYADGATQLKYPSRIQQPARAMLAMDSMNALALPHFGNTKSLEAAASRYNGSVTVLFCDGHVEMVEVDVADPDSVFINTSTPERRLFWFGSTNNI